MRRLPSLVVLALLMGVGGRAQEPSLSADVDALYPGLEELYYDLHRHPELAFHETRTSELLAKRLQAIGYDVTTGVGGTGVVALLKNGAGSTVMLRTELDALPIEEKTGVPFASTATGVNASGQTVPVMHACGHDLHMAAWIGTAEWMAANRDRWRGTVMLVAQPAEERIAGASAMLKDGLFERFPKPDFAFGLHVDDTMPAGTIGYRPGFFRAASAGPVITIFGRGGHGAMPHNTIDPVVIAARTVLALQTIVAREVSPMEPVVVTVGSIRGGTQGNIIPDEVRLDLTVRAFDENVKAKVLVSIERMVKAEALAAGAPREPMIQYGAGDAHAVYNDPDLTNRLAAALRKTIGEDRVVEMAPKMTSEDFSEYGRTGVPAALLHIGAVTADALADAKRTGVPVPAPHSPEWLPVLEPTLKAAVRAEISILLELLGTSR